MNRKRKRKKTKKKKKRRKKKRRKRRNIKHYKMQTNSTMKKWVRD